MKKRVFIITSVILFLFSSCSTKQKTQFNLEDKITETQTSVTSQTIYSNHTQQSLTQQKQLLVNYLKKSLETHREEANGRFVLGEGMPFDLEIKNNYYAFFDIDGDGNIELIRGFKDEDYFKLVEEKNLGNIIINNIIYISNGEAKSLNYYFIMPGSDAVGVPIIYSNGIIRDGGKESDDYQEFYYYLNSKGEIILCLRHFFKTESTDDKYVIDNYSNGEKTTEKAVTKEKYYSEKAKLEINPINETLEWEIINKLL